MWETSAIKQQGKAAFRMNYWKCVLVSILLGMLTAGTTTSVSYNTSQNNEQQIESAYQEMQGAVESLTMGQRMALIAGVSGIITMVLIIGILLKMFVYNPLKVGCFTFFKDNVGNPPADFGSIGVGFHDYVHTFISLFLTDLFLTLWTMLFIVPGLIKAYSYRMVPYILAEHPEMPPTEIITMSRQMMDGHKWHAFCYDLSFIGWYILTVLTLGILGVFWVGPYKDNSDAALYLAVRGTR